MKLTVLGATGSIGVSTLDVVARHPDRFEVVALTGPRQVEVLAAGSGRPMPWSAVRPMRSDWPEC
jgi:1-deoxy-D-xylulose-5-phosphate reductoisomerase